jgi:protease-4
VFWVILSGSLLFNFSTCMMFAVSGLSAGSREYPIVSETLAYGSPLADEKVALLRLDGVIIREEAGTLFGPSVDPVTKLLTEIQAAKMDDDVRAILLEVNSPGGGVTASDEIFHALMEFKRTRPDRVVVVHVQDMAASGGYYAALAADRIVAQPTSVVGSVGVMLSAINLHGLSEKLGIQDVSLTSSDNKALLNALEPVNPEHTEILQQVVDSLYVRFRDLVLEHRPFDAEFADAHSLLDGRIFTGPEALELQLIDRLGYADQARGEVLDLLKVSEAGFYEMEFTGGWSGLFGAKGSGINLPVIQGAQFLYMWKP